MKFSQPQKLITITVIPFDDQEAYTQTFDSVRRKLVSNWNPMKRQVICPEILKRKSLILHKQTSGMDHP